MFKGSTPTLSPSSLAITAESVFPNLAVHRYEEQELPEGGLRIPAIVRWPGRIRHSVSDQAMITMDWVPTLLAAAGTSMDPVSAGWRLTERSAPHPRKFYWRYKAGSQRAIRDGDWKYLRINGNEFLFDVVRDPRERANLKERNKDVFDGLKNDWEVWNATMLEERPRPAPLGFPGNLLADHYGVTNPISAGPATPPPTRRGHQDASRLVRSPSQSSLNQILERSISCSRTGLGFLGTASLRRLMRPIQRFTYSRRFINLRPGYCFRACALQVASCCERNRSLVDFAA